MYQRILTEVVLLGCSVTDLKCKKIYKAVVAAYILLALLGHAAGRTAMPAGIASGLLPGVFCLVVSWLSRQGLGYGDSVLILGCGISVGLWPCVEILFLSFFLAGVWAAGLLVFHRVGREKEIPFAPFLFLGALIGGMG